MVHHAPVDLSHAGHVPYHRSCRNVPQPIQPVFVLRLGRALRVTNLRTVLLRPDARSRRLTGGVLADFRDRLVADVHRVAAHLRREVPARKAGTERGLGGKYGFDKEKIKIPAGQYNISVNNGSALWVIVDRGGKTTVLLY